MSTVEKSGSRFPDAPLGLGATETLTLLRHMDEYGWMRRGERRTLKFFHEAAQRVPAYKDFLEKNGVKPELVKTIGDFKKIPLTTKENYLLQYPLAELSWDGNFTRGKWIISSTSGSTGEPFYFPRTRYQDEQFTLTAELCFREFFGIERKSTLFIDCFALGVWIGGMFMYQVVRTLIDSGRYRLSLITPGADKTEAIKAFKNLAPHFDQVIIGGYAPLVKDLIDDGVRAGIEWRKYDVKYFFAAEGFTEGFRDYIVAHGGVKHPLAGTLNHYGTADLGTMAHETPLSILVRRLAVNDEALFGKIFPEAYREPTLTQFIPELFYFEEVEGVLACSALGGLPLLRYNLKDRGGVATLEAVAAHCAARGMDLFEEARQRGVGNMLWQLPFVYLYERDDLVASIYSVNIYPQSIQRALQRQEFEEMLTGKFTLWVDYDGAQNQVLKIYIELKTGARVGEAFEGKVLAAVLEVLHKENSEWRDFYAQEHIRDKVTPRLEFLNYQDPAHFAPGRKQKWVKKKA
ncbi:MAG: phenylacetate--CoA ligase family protein [Candidatus Liptonbacteria bacterium]|nr:phenylacetate--CoA ligase family protein [Candidatus Liptonbacteria bacterium]